MNCKLTGVISHLDVLNEFRVFITSKQLDELQSFYGEDMQFINIYDGSYIKVKLSKFYLTEQNISFIDCFLTDNYGKLCIVYFTARKNKKTQNIKFFLENIELDDTFILDNLDYFS